VSSGQGSRKGDGQRRGQSRRGGSSRSRAREETREIDQSVHQKRSEIYRPIAALRTLRHRALPLSAIRDGRQPVAAAYAALAPPPPLPINWRLHLSSMDPLFVDRFHSGTQIHAWSAWSAQRGTPGGSQRSSDGQKTPSASLGSSLCLLLVLLMTVVQSSCCSRGRGMACCHWRLRECRVAQIFRVAVPLSRVVVASDQPKKSSHVT
jgi:hypothetical protein